MIFLNNGKVQFDDFFELTYNLFSEMGISLNNENYIYDQDTCQPIKFKEKYIKASFTPQPIYPGRNDIIFEPNKNYNLMVSLFGWFMDKYLHSEDCKINYVAHFVDETPEKQQRVVLRTTQGDISTMFYSHLYLSYIETIFLLTDSINPDLHNFDIDIM